MVVWKTCSRCKKDFTTREEFLSQTVTVTDCDAMGLALRNCTCGTTLGVWAECLFPQRARELLNSYSKLAKKVHSNLSTKGSHCDGCPHTRECVVKRLFSVEKLSDTVL